MQQSEIAASLINKFPGAAEEAGTDAIVISGGSLLGVARYLKSEPLDFDNLHCITAVDRKDKIELVYIFYSIGKHHTLTLKIYLSPEDPAVESLSGIWKSANWLERETYDLMGVTFLHHPDPRRILNPYDWNGYPLRKDYVKADMKPKPRL